MSRRTRVPPPSRRRPSRRSAARFGAAVAARAAIGPVAAFGPGDRHDGATAIAAASPAVVACLGLAGHGGLLVPPPGARPHDAPAWGGFAPGIAKQGCRGVNAVAPAGAASKVRGGSGWFGCRPFATLVPAVGGGRSGPAPGPWQLRFWRRLRPDKAGAAERLPHLRRSARALRRGVLFRFGLSAERTLGSAAASV